MNFEHSVTDKCTNEFTGKYSPAEAKLLNQAECLSRGIYEAYCSAHKNTAYELFLVASGLNETDWKRPLKGPNTEAFEDFGRLIWLSHARQINAIGREVERSLSDNQRLLYSKVDSVDVSFKGNECTIRAVLDSDGTDIRKLLH